MRHGAAILTSDEERRFIAARGRRKGWDLATWVRGSVREDHRRRPRHRQAVPRCAFWSCGRSSRRPTAFYTGEKLAPVLSMFTVAGEDEGLQAVPDTAEHRRRRAHRGDPQPRTPHASSGSLARCPAGRILVNSSAAQGCCGMTHRARLLVDAGLRHVRRQLHHRQRHIPASPEHQTRRVSARPNVKSGMRSE